MKRILCENTTCIHNEYISHELRICARCDDIRINVYHDRCDGYEEANSYIKRINEEK